MSDTYLRLVEALTPPGRRYRVGPPAVARDRYVLLALAYFCDEYGCCTASVSKLSAFTLLSPPVIRMALYSLEHGHGVVAVEREPSRPNNYRLQREALAALRHSNLLRATGAPVDLLFDYGVSVRTVNALRREDIGDIEELVELLSYYRELPESARPSLRDHLGVTGLGTASAVKLASAVERWCADEADRALAPGVS